MTYIDGKIEEGVWRDDKFLGAPSQAITSPAASAENSKIGSVSVVADDQTYEIFVDGSFVGNAPSKLKLGEGSHMIEVKKAGFKDYRKDVKVIDGSELTLRPELLKQ